MILWCLSVHLPWNSIEQQSQFLLLLYLWSININIYLTEMFQKKYITGEEIEKQKGLEKVERGSQLSLKLHWESLCRFLLHSNYFNFHSNPRVNWFVNFKGLSFFSNFSSCNEIECIWNLNTSSNLYSSAGSDRILISAHWL